MRLKHIVSARDFDYMLLLEIFRLTAEMKKLYQDPKTRAGLKYTLIKNDGNPYFIRIIADPSTRTVTTFEDAIRALGGESRKDQPKFSSLYKGESHKSTARIIGPRCDGIIIRDDNDNDAAKNMVEATRDYNLETAIIDAGSGSYEHPTQMLVDLFTIWERDQVRLTAGALNYAMVGDLSHSRTIHSLLIGLKNFGGNIYLVGPYDNELPDWLVQEVKKSSLNITYKIYDPLNIADIIDYWYFTRLQTNLRKNKVFEKDKQDYIEECGVSDALRGSTKKGAFFMHPLPHGKEFPEGIDIIDPRFIHNLQADNGFYLRMTLLKMIFAGNLDIHTSVSEHEKVTASGFFEDIEIPIKKIIAVCAIGKCPNVRVENNNWVKIDPVVKERLVKARVFCSECRPL